MVTLFFSLFDWLSCAWSVWSIICINKTHETQCLASFSYWISIQRIIFWFSSKQCNAQCSPVCIVHIHGVLKLPIVLCYYQRLHIEWIHLPTYYVANSSDASNNANDDWEMVSLRFITNNFFCRWIGHNFVLYFCAWVMSLSLPTTTSGHYVTQ